MPDPWDGVCFKLNMAQFYLGEMRKDLIPATAEPEFFCYQQRSTSPPMNQWDPKFYYHLDAFLAATRSVDFVITTIFGKDKNNGFRKWIATPSTLERKERKSFQDAYDLIADPFRENLLSHIRNVSIHRSGTPSVKVAVLGQYDTLHRGGPTENLSAFEEPEKHTVADPNHPPPIRMNPMKRAIEPGHDDFFVLEVSSLDGSARDHPLFQKCDGYLQSASELVDKAKSLAERVHTHPVTLPPLYKI
jgi:hypothetical protein